MATGERIRVVRIARGMAVADLAAESEIDAADLEAFETDEKEPEPEQLWDIAQGLDFPLDFFLRSLPVTTLIPANPEGQPGLSAEERDEIIAQARVMLERYFDIESFYPIDEIPLFELPDGFPLTISTPHEAAQAGETLRRAWALQHLPIASLADMLEDAGIKVGLVDGVGAFDAAAFVTDDELEIPVIAVNSQLNGDMQRFAMARELAFIVLDGVTFQTANHFAGALLAPAEALRHELGASRTNLEFYELQMLKQKYGLSMRRLITRAASVRIISKDELAKWLNMFKASGWTTDEPGFEFPAEQPRRMIRLAIRLQAEGEIEPERAAELLDLDEDAWDSLLNYDEALTGAAQEELEEAEA